MANFNTIINAILTKKERGGKLIMIIAHNYYNFTICPLFLLLLKITLPHIFRSSSTFISFLKKHISLDAKRHLMIVIMKIL